TGHAFTSAASVYFAAVATAPTSSAGAAITGAVQRFRAHLGDVANFEPLALIALAPILRRPWRRPLLLTAGLLVVEAIAAAPLPLTTGPGAPALAELLPVEHALLAIGLAELVTGRFAEAALATFGLALAGFGLHTAHDHAHLAASG